MIPCVIISASEHDRACYAIDACLSQVKSWKDSERKRMLLPNLQIIYNVLNDRDDIKVEYD